MLRLGLNRLLTRGVCTTTQLGVKRIRSSPVVFSNYFKNSLNASATRFYSQPKEATEVEDADDEYYIDVSDIESRWITMNFEAQQDIISYLNVKQEFGWEYLSKDEKKAICYIAYGTWGPRDAKVMNTAEFVFKLMTNMLLFSVLGFSVLNYTVDKKKVAELEEAAAEVSV